MVYRFHEQYILPNALKYQWKNFLEIGVSFGSHTRKLIKLAEKNKGNLICIDPSPILTLKLKLKFLLDRKKKLIRKTSIVALKELKNHSYDCVVIDGDHNYYTVYNELTFIKDQINKSGMIFLHDVDWPYARRDMYYNPNSIPPEYLKPHSKKGIVKENELLVEDGGKNSHLFNANIEGGPQNGVLTAIEDFIKKNPKFSLEIIQGNEGLGILRIDQ